MPKGLLSAEARKFMETMGRKVQESKTADDFQPGDKVVHEHLGLGRVHANHHDERHPEKGARYTIRYPDHDLKLYHSALKPHEAGEVRSAHAPIKFNAKVQQPSAPPHPIFAITDNMRPHAGKAVAAQKEQADKQHVERVAAIEAGGQAMGEGAKAGAQASIENEKSGGAKAAKPAPKAMGKSEDFSKAKGQRHGVRHSSQIADGDPGYLDGKDLDFKEIERPSKKASDKSKKALHGLALPRADRVPMSKAAEDLSKMGGGWGRRRGGGHIEQYHAKHAAATAKKAVVDHHGFDEEQVNSLEQAHGENVIMDNYKPENHLHPDTVKAHTKRAVEAYRRNNPHSTNAHIPEANVDNIKTPMPRAPELPVNPKDSQTWWGKKRELKARMGKSEDEDLEKRSKNVRAQIRNASPESEEKRLKQFSSKQGIDLKIGESGGQFSAMGGAEFGGGGSTGKKGSNEIATPKKPEFPIGNPVSQRQTAIHELAHVVTKPAGRSLAEHQKVMNGEMNTTPGLKDEAVVAHVEPKLARRAGVKPPDTRPAANDPKLPANKHYHDPETRQAATRGIAALDAGRVIQKAEDEKKKPAKSSNADQALAEEGESDDPMANGEEGGLEEQPTNNVERVMSGADEGVFEDEPLEPIEDLGPEKHTEAMEHHVSSMAHHVQRSKLLNSIGDADGAAIHDKISDEHYKHAQAHAKAAGVSEGEIEFMHGMLKPKPGGKFEPHEHDWAVGGEEIEKAERDSPFESIRFPHTDKFKNDGLEYKLKAGGSIRWPQDGDHLIHTSAKGRATKLGLDEKPTKNHPKEIRDHHEAIAATAKSYLANPLRKSMINAQDTFFQHLSDTMGASMRKRGIPYSYVHKWDGGQSVYSFRTGNAELIHKQHGMNIKFELVKHEGATDRDVLMGKILRTEIQRFYFSEPIRKSLVELEKTKDRYSKNKAAIQESGDDPRILLAGSNRADERQDALIPARQAQKRGSLPPRGHAFAGNAQTLYERTHTRNTPKNKVPMTGDSIKDKQDRNSIGKSEQVRDFFAKALLWARPKSLKSALGRKRKLRGSWGRKRQLRGPRSSQRSANTNGGQHLGGVLHTDDGKKVT